MKYFDIHVTVTNAHDSQEWKRAALRFGFRAKDSREAAAKVSTLIGSMFGPHSVENDEKWESWDVESAQGGTHDERT